MKPIAILKTGTTIASIAARRGDFSAWFQAGLGQSICIVDAQSAALPPADEFAGIVVTGSAAMVSQRLDWSERAGDWLLQAISSKLPVLGVCYGHQLLAQALGGVVGKNPNGREIGSKLITLQADYSDDPLLQGLRSPLYAQTTHEESVLELPANAQVLATTEQDPQHVIRFTETAWGVQFHPEFDADIMRNYLHARRANLEQEGLDTEALLAEVRETPQAWSLLQRFAQLVH